ncbi:hypothetical protein [Tahibacter soli]|uniref:Dicarboxylate transport n=1 Tax=Tahibacter soli TaxID=2983605 RepID=A0A9X3YH47_9GAMM|nr:hypothetical protein [Tahibacter soli]MDC8012142.1 hypothetical protein [Tahibacter soli]
MLRTALAAMLALSFAPVADARVARVRLDRLETASIIAQGIEVKLAGDAPRLTLDVARLSAPTLSGAEVALHAECALAKTDVGWRCAGDASSQAGKASAKAGFDATIANGRLALAVERKPAKLRVAQGDAGAWRFTLDGLPLAWFEAQLAAQWPDAKPPAGTLGADLAWRADEPARVRGSYRIAGFGFDANGGRIAAANLAFGGKLDVDARAAPPVVSHAGAIDGGEILVGDFYAKFADARTALDFTLTGGGGRWTLKSMRFDDPGVLRVAGSAQIDLAASPPLAALALDTVEATLPAAFERYAKSALAPRSFGELATGGSLRGSLRVDAAGLAAFSIAARQVDAVDAQQRFALRGVDGAVAWSRDGATEPSPLAWRSIELYKLTFDETRTVWRSRDGVLGLAEPARLPLFGGAIEVSRLDVRPDAARNERLAAGFAVHDVDMARLSAAFGWPSFGGKLGGAVPQIRYAGERAELDGGLMLNVFDGTINVTGLALERPFGVAPTLAADIAFSGLDLSLLTGTFDFGEISGRLSGSIAALRLVDWSPVSFDAQMHALDGGKISQRAVNSLSSVGGGGFVAGLQASVLRIFDTFGYARLGLGCRLENNVCRMRGLDSSPQGYTLVDGRGLPRIRIVGHQAQVDWPVLVERLKAATSGTKPVIN